MEESLETESLKFTGIWDYELRPSRAGYLVETEKWNQLWGQDF